MLDNTDGFTILVGEKATDQSDIIKSLCTGFGEVKAFRLSSVQERNLTEEERAIRNQPTAIASEQFSRNRLKHLRALRAIIASVFKKFDLEGKCGLDIGSGATGFFVSDLLPKDTQKNGFTQLEINPEAVRKNRVLHPELASKIIEGSYHDIPQEKINPKPPLELVTGLSSLDNTADLPHAIEEIAGVLVMGGFLVHFQDVRPGEGTGSREMKAMGHTPPYQGFTFTPQIPNIPGMKMPEGIFGPLAYQVPNEGLISVVELFRRQINRALESSPHFDIVINEWVTARKTSRNPMNESYFMNMNIMTDRPYSQASGVVTVARRKPIAL